MAPVIFIIEPSAMEVVMGFPTPYRGEPFTTLLRKRIAISKSLAFARRKRRQRLSAAAAAHNERHIRRGLELLARCEVYMRAAQYRV